MKKEIKELALAYDTIRGYQSKRFVELLRGVTTDEHAQTVNALNILREHGSAMCQLSLTAETCILLSGLLASLDTSVYPDLDKCRQNFIVAVCQTVDGIGPVLTSVALGKLLTPKLVSPWPPTK